MKNALNPYGQGNAAQKTVDAIEKYYDEGILNISAPEEVMDSFERKMTQVNDDITVSEFEQKEDALIHMMFDGEKMRFPTDETKLKGMMITYDKRK